MRLLIETSNPFYEGWLSCVFGLEKRLPSEVGVRESWECGWDTAKETSPNFRAIALLAEIELNTNVTLKEARSEVPTGH